MPGNTLASFGHVKHSARDPFKKRSLREPGNVDTLAHMTHATPSTLIVETKNKAVVMIATVPAVMKNNLTKE